jgi:hypothetical protein
LADRLGFYENAVFEMEASEDFLERWPIELIRTLSRELLLPLQTLLDYPCPKCGK